MWSSSVEQDFLRECSKDDASFQRLVAAFEAQRSLSTQAMFACFFQTFLPEVAIWIDDAEKISFSTPKCQALLGYTTEELHGYQWETLCHPNEVSVLNQITDSLSPETVQVKHRLRHRNGSYVWVETTFSKKQIGHLQGILAISRDITPHHDTETKLRDSEEKFFSAFHASPLPQFVSTLDEGRILEANQAFADMVGIERDAIVGHTTVELGISVDVALREQLYDQLRETGSLRDVEYLFRGTDGKIRTVLLSAERFEIHHQPCWLGMYYDITEHKAAEAARVASEQKFATIFESNPIPMTLSDLATTELVEVNPAFCRMIGLPSTKLRGFSTLELGLVVDPVTHQEFYRHAELQGSVPEIEQRFRTHDGQIRTVLASAETIDVNGKPHLLSMFHDITDRKQAEETLAAERQMLRALIDHLPHFIYHKDTEARFLISNIANTRVLGLESVEEAVGKSDLDFYPPDLAAEFYADDRAVISSGQPLINHEEMGRDAQGRSRWVLTSKFPLRNRAGEVTGLVGIGIDITERKQAEAELRASEERFYKAFWGSPFGMVIIDLRSQRIIDANPTGLRIGGLSREELIGQTVESVGFMLAPAVRAEFDRQLTQDGHVRGLEASWVKNGQTTMVKFAAEIIEIGGAPHLLVMFDDITSQKIAEAALESARLELIYERNLLRQLIDHLPDGVFVKDAAGRYLLMNKRHAQLAGYPVEALMGKTALEAFPDLGETYFADDLQVIQSGQPLLGREERLIHREDPSLPDGWCITSKIPICNADGLTVAMVGLQVDITAHKLADMKRLENEKLQTALQKERELNDLKTRMMQRISHEFRTPLAIIQTAANLLLNYQDRLSIEQRRKLSGQIEEQITTLTDMLHIISEIVREDFPKHAMQSEHVDFPALVQAAIEKVEAQDHSRHPIRFESIQPSIPALNVMGDPYHLRTLVINLLSNACLYSPLERPVTVNLTREDTFLQLQVQDEGIGILPDELDRVTEAFFRGSNFDERPGLGLGLTTAKNIIDLHHGTLHIESTAGQGTLVTVRLPISFET